MSEAEVDSEDVYRAVLRLAFRDGEVGGEEMDWLRRMAELLDIGKADRKRIQADIRFQSRMEQLGGDDEPADVFRDVCKKAWRNAALGAAEVEALEDLARAFGFDRARAEGILAGTAPSGATVPDLPDVEGEGRPDSPAPPAAAAAPASEAKPEAEVGAEEAVAPPEGGGLPVTEALVVLAVLAAVAAVFVL